MCALRRRRGAAILQARPTGRGIISSVMASDGRLSDLLKIPGGGSRLPTTPETLSARMHYIKMNGREVFKHAVSSMLSAAQEALRRGGIGVTKSPALFRTKPTCGSFRRSDNAWARR